MLNQIKDFRIKHASLYERMAFGNTEIKIRNEISDEELFSRQEIKKKYTIDKYIIFVQLVLKLESVYDFQKILRDLLEEIKKDKSGDIFFLKQMVTEILETISLNSNINFSVNNPDYDANKINNIKDLLKEITDELSIDIAIQIMDTSLDEEIAKNYEQYFGEIERKIMYDNDRDYARRLVHSSEQNYPSAPSSAQSPDPIYPPAPPSSASSMSSEPSDK